MESSSPEALSLVAPAANRRSRFTGDTALLAYIGIAGIIIHLLFANNYGYFRDELYYIVSGQHLQLGYVDFPPLIAYLAGLIGIAGGDSLFAIHAVPAVVDGILVFVAGMSP